MTSNAKLSELVHIPDTNFVRFEDEEILKSVNHAQKFSITYIPQESDREKLSKLFHELNERNEKLTRQNRILKSAIGEFFTRKNIPRAFHQLNDEEIEKFTEKYNEVLEILCKIKKKKKTLDEENTVKLLKMQNEVESLTAAKNENKNEFQSIVKETVVELEKAGLPITEKFIIRLLKRFERTHDEISHARLDYIKTQNSVVEQQTKDEELDEIGEGYSVMEYENLKIELQTISSNIDAKNEDLEKLRLRYTRDVEKGEDFRKNYEQLENKIKNQRQMFESRRYKEQELRWQLNSMRKQKDLMRIEMDKLVQKSQLLTKVPLLRNFDNMSDGIENVSEEINRVEAKNSQIMNKIERMVSKVGNLRSHEADLKQLDEFIAQERTKLEKFFKPRECLELKKN